MNRGTETMTQNPAPATGGGVPANRAPPSRQQTAAALLKRIRETHLIVRKDFAAMLADFQGRREASGSSSNFLWPSGVRVRQPRSEEERARVIQWLFNEAVAQPDPVEVKSLLDRIAAAEEAGFNAPEARVAVALMIDAYPNARPHSPEAYIASIIDELEGEDVPTLAISEACHELKTTAVFLPSLAEVLEKVKECAKSLRLRRGQLARYLDWTERATAASEWMTTIPLQPDKGVEPEIFAGNDPF